MLYIIAFVVLAIILFVLNSTYWELTFHPFANSRDPVLKRVPLWGTIFIIFAGILLIYTTAELFRQKSRRKNIENELATALNRISDAVISVDNDWRFLYMNDAGIDLFIKCVNKVAPYLEIHAATIN